MTISTQPAHVPSSAGTPPARRRPRLEGVLLLTAVVLLGISLALPWWSETEVFGTNTWTQSFSPITGVSGQCSPSCGALDVGPPTGPVNGVESFSALGLNQTEALYDTSLAFVAVGLLSGILALVIVRDPAKGRSPTRRIRVRKVALTFALLAIAIGCALLPVLQPMALRADTMGEFTAHNAWTASPSPETSFWGGCTPGPTSGTCASGGSASWGPALGWDLLAVALALLVVVHLGLIRRTNRLGERTSIKE